MLAVDKLILIIILVVVLLLVIGLVFLGRQSGDPIVLQNTLRQCCIGYRARGCPDYSELSTDPLYCSDKDVVIIARDQLGMSETQLRNFCGCS